MGSVEEEEETDGFGRVGFRFEVEVGVESTGLLTEGIEMEVIMLASSRANAPCDLNRRYRYIENGIHR